MAYEIKECSPKAKSKIAKDAFDAIGVEVSEHHRVKYPFSQLHIGYCFVVPIVEANESSLRLSATVKGKQSGKKFSVIKHEDFGCFEVARIA